MTSDPDLVYTTEAAEILGVGVRTIARMAQDGRLRPAAEKRGETSALVFIRGDVEALAASQTEQAS